MKKKKYSLVFIVNPFSAECNQEKILTDLKRGLSGYSYIIHFPESVEAAGTICGELEPTRCNAVIIVGGDGTFSRTIPHLIHKKIPIYVFPVGRSNHLANYLGCTGDVAQLKGLLDSKSFSPIDLIEVNGSIFATVGGVGIGAILSTQISHWHRFRTFKKLMNFFDRQIHALQLALKVLFVNDYIREIKVTTNGQSSVYHSSGVFVCNQPQRFGRVVVAADARNDDGKLEVYILLDKRKRQIIKTLFDMQLGVVPPRVIQLTTSEVMLESVDGKALAIYGDGERLLQTNSASFKILPSAIQIYSQNVEAIEQVPENLPRAS